MFRSKSVLGIAVAGALALSAVSAAAQDVAGSHELHIYGGQLFGDDLTSTKVSGRKPELDDDVTYGIRYGYNVSDTLGIELSLGQSANSVTGLAGRDIDLDLTTLDVDAVWRFNTGTKLVPYVLAGVGYAIADLDRPIVGTVNGQTVSIRDDNGFTMNAGAGLKYYAADNFLVRLEARYRYLDSVVDRFDDSLNTVETTLGIGWTF